MDIEYEERWKLEYQIAKEILRMDVPTLLKFITRIVKTEASTPEAQRFMTLEAANSWISWARRKIDAYEETHKE